MKIMQEYLDDFNDEDEFGVDHGVIFCYTDPNKGNKPYIKAVARYDKLQEEMLTGYLILSVFVLVVLGCMLVYYW